MSTVFPATEPLTSTKHGLFIGGEWVETGQHDEVRLPYDGSVVGLVSHATGEHVDEAVKSAQEGSRAMAAMPNHQRAELLLRIADQVRTENTDLARLICAET